MAETKKRRIKGEVRIVSMIVVGHGHNGMERDSPLPNRTEVFGLDEDGRVWRYRTTIVDKNPKWHLTEIAESRRFQWVEPRPIS